MSYPRSPLARHDALQYHDDDQLLDAVVPYLREGAEAGDSVVLICRPDNAARLRDALDGHRIAELAYGDVYGGTIAALTAYRELVAREQQRGSSRVRVVTEIDFGSRPSGQWEWARFDAALGHALADYPVWNLCLYDRRRVPADILRAGESSHSHLLAEGGRVPSARYTDPVTLLGEAGMRWRDPLEDAPPRLDVAGPHDLAALRAAVEQTLLGDGMSAYAVQGFVLAVSEVATNAILHGAAPVRVRLWSDGRRALCSVSDGGRCFSAYSGYVPTDRVVGAGGMGLWLARQMTDDLTIDAADGGCVVRLGLNA
ncbi:anti-sigma factor RsbA family regulatory protein [Catellatospora vulcania]|uniref:anti-sigma factor RsbA family regulatory protein n=1 Tax=Catellatospora vulcania TaxID=1460450 RepID=UPI0012D3D697|nr:anti-sigma factor RsbA family regulatory protein [Catellatospora vulcania]